MRLLIYGITGYTGGLVAERAAELGLKPTVAGRDPDRTRAVAERYGFAWTAFRLDDKERLREALGAVDAVLHLAGPFSATASPMAAACVATRTHYLDITGEIAVFEALAGIDREAREAGVMLMPGCGFDVVPSDCLAAHVKRRLPDAAALDIFITGLGHTSRGTAKTAVESIRYPARVRRNGRIVALNKPLRRRFRLPEREAPGISVSWGDVATAWYTTGIPDITVYFEEAGPLKALGNLNPLLRWLLSTPIGQRYLKAEIDKRPPGPTPEQRAKSFALILAEARNAKGETARALLRTPEGYTLTAMTTLEIARRVLEEGAAVPGFQTPARVFGADFILEFPGCTRRDLDAGEPRAAG